jgi:tRNA threonylcarbamoyladenosine biosynthesis protein TsaE
MPEIWKAIRNGAPFQQSELHKVAEELLKQTDKRIWLMNGGMGAGKTTLIKAMGELLGVRGVMSSPTFSIINEYVTQNGESIYHFDFYRLKNETEAMDIGIEEYLDSGNYCFLEWPDRISSLIPTRFFDVKIKEDTPTTRIIEYLDHE